MQRWRPCWWRIFSRMRKSTEQFLYFFLQTISWLAKLLCSWHDSHDFFFFWGGGGHVNRPITCRLLCWCRLVMDQQIFEKFFKQQLANIYINNLWKIPLINHSTIRGFVLDKNQHCEMQTSSKFSPMLCKHPSTHECLTLVPKDGRVLPLISISGIIPFWNPF